jgi:hypothetical protein
MDAAGADSSPFKGREKFVEYWRRFASFDTPPGRRFACPGYTCCAEQGEEKVLRDGGVHYLPVAWLAFSLRCGFMKITEILYSNIK